MHDFPRIAFIGGGNMAGALIEGLLEQGCDPARLAVIDVSEQAQRKWRERGLQVTDQPSDALRQCEVWLLAVKPQQLHQVVISARPFLQPGTLVISIAAGISLSSLSQWLGNPDTPEPAVIRAMPNTPALVGQGVTGLAAAQGVQQPQRAVAEQLLSCVGEVVWVKDDAQIDAVTALSGSGPAYVFRFIEGLIAGGQALGLDSQQARALALATVSGAATLAARSDEPVEVLRDRVTSKGGTTAAALDVMQSRQFHETVIVAMKAAYERSGQLSAEFGTTDA
jgi:pyrroline-5-carboxylate reductase